MSNSVNQVYLLGHLGADPELSQTREGRPFLKFRMATSERWTDKEGQKHERTDWHRITVFGNRAQPLHTILRKGSQVMVDGQIRMSSYEKNGEKRTGFDIHARDIVITGRRTPAEAYDNDAAPAPLRAKRDEEYTAMIN